MKLGGPVGDDEAALEARTVCRKPQLLQVWGEWVHRGVYCLQAALRWVLIQVDPLTSFSYTWETAVRKRKEKAMTYARWLQWTLAGIIAVAVCAAALGIYAKDSGKQARRAEPTTPEEALRNAEKDWSAMERARKQVRKYLNEAQKKKDIIRINCVQEKLVRINTAMGLAREVLGRLRVAAKKEKAMEKSSWLYQKISILREQVENLRREAEACADEEISYTGDTKVRLFIDPSIPRDDPTEPPEDIVVVGRPPEASPYI